MDIGIIGAGHFGANHARALKNVANARIVAACRNDRAALTEFCNEFSADKIIKPYLNYQDLLNDDSIKAVLIATPHALHAEIAINAAKAGKHIMLEKPMSLSVEQCHQIMGAANTAGVVLMMGHTMRFMYTTQLAQEIILTKKLGALKVAHTKMIKLWMEANRQPWHLRQSQGGGLLMTAGIHALDRLLMYAGQAPTHMNALMGAMFHQQDADDTALLLMRFGEEMYGQVSSIGFSNGGFIASDELIFENGVMTIDFFKGIRIAQEGEWQEVPNSIEDNMAHKALERQWISFLNAINTGTMPIVTGHDGLLAVACIEAAKEANDLRKEIALSRYLN